MSTESDTASADAARALLEYSVTPSTLLQTLDHALSPVDPSGNPKDQANVMVWGAMGIGKSDVVKTLGRLWGMRLVALHLPQFDPTDLKGIPVRDEDGTVRWVPSSYLPQQLTYTMTEDDGGTYNRDIQWPSAKSIMVHVRDADGKTVARAGDLIQGDLKPKGLEIHINGTTHVHVTGLTAGQTVIVIDRAILFLDELSAAVPEVQNAALQLVLDKRVGEYDVPLYTPIVAAGNRESDQAFVSPMSMPLANRFMHLRLTHSLDDWLEWAFLNKVDPTIVAFLQWKKNALFQFDPDAATEGDYGFPTPRSWAMLSSQMNGIDALPEAVQSAIVTGFLGRSMGQTFIEHRKVADQLPSVDDILQGKEVEIPETLNVGARYHLATSLCYALADYHEKHYDESIGGGADKQGKEWRTATEAFCSFVDQYLGKEMTVLCVHIASRHLNISFVKFRGTAFKGFAEKYRDVLRRTV